MKTIYNTYVIMTSQEQCDRMEQFCLDNNLPIWDDICSFALVEGLNIFTYYKEENEFFVMCEYADVPGKTEVTEEEFKSLV